MTLEQTYSLTRDEVDFFTVNGYLGPFRAVSEDEMATIRAQIEADVLTTDGPKPTTRMGSRHMDRRVIYDLATHPAIIERMACIYGPDLVMWASNLWLKNPGGKEIPFHQDINFWPLEPPVNISAWIAIDNVTVENSCVKIIPGSHRQTIPHIQAREDMAFQEMADPAHFNVNTAINMELRPGEFFLFTERLLHGSSKNESDKRRLGMSIRVTLPIVRMDQDNPPLQPGHTAVLAHGRDPMGFTRYGGRPER